MEKVKKPINWVDVAKVVVKVITYVLAVIGGSSFTEATNNLTSML